MKVFVIGVTGGIGGLVAEKLQSRGDTVSGLVRRTDQQTELASRGVQARVGDLASLSAQELAATFGDAEAIVYTAGSNGGAREVTKAIDGDGVATAVAAAGLAGIARLVLVSVLPESWRERELDDEVEYYFAVKKGADVEVSRSDLDWLILRPSLLTDGPGADAATTVVELLHEPRLGRQILEVNEGATPITEAVRANVRTR